MSRIDLNIIDRGIKGTEWIAEDVSLTPEHLDEVMEQRLTIAVLLILCQHLSLVSL